MGNDLSISQIEKLFDCDFEAGILYWKARGAEYFSEGKIGAEAYARAWNKRFAGKPAFTSTNGAGYKHGTIFGDFYLAHRIIFSLYHGFFPDIIDHKNGNTNDNSINNLISASHRENLMNCKKFSHNTSGITGVVWVKEKQKWKAEIKVKKKAIFLGYFLDILLAEKARLEAEAKYGFSKRHGKDL